MDGIVGRTTERRLIADAVASVAEGGGLLLAISGEPGVGKTLLAGEALRLARDVGFRTLRGTCARYQQDVSYGPLLQALRPLVDPADPAASDRVAGLPELSRLFTGLDLPEPAPARTEGQDRGRMFDAVYTLLHRSTTDRPLALLIDDAHWADPGTLDLLAYLALGLGERSCLFVVTDRRDPGGSVRRVRSPLRRADRVVDVRLRPLTRDEVGELVTQRLAGEPPAPLVDLLDGRAQGIPLYVTSLLAFLHGRGRLFRSGGRWVLGTGQDPDLPDDLVEVIADQLDELTAPELAVLSALAVWGNGASRGMLGALAGVVDLDEGLDRLIQAGLVDERTGAAGTYGAHHPLVIEAAGARLSARERRDQHAAAARYLLEHPGSAGAQPRAIAHHVRLAGPAFDPKRALGILTAAATDPSERSGHEDLLLAEAIVGLIRQCGPTESLPAALERLADAAALTGDIAAAIEAWQEAAAGHADDPGAASRCLRRCALLYLELGRGAEANRVLDQALDLAPQSTGPAERFHVLLLRTTFSLRSGDRARLLADLPALRTAADRIGLPDIADLFARYARARTDRLMVPAAARDYLTLGTRVMAAAGLSDERSLTVPWHRPWIVGAINNGDLAEARRRARLVPEHSAVSPGSFPAAVALEALAEWLAGRWDTALRLTGQALVIAHRQASPRSITLALVVRGLILAHRGEVDRATDCVGDARAVFGHGDPHVVSAIDTVAAQLALHRMESERALALLNGAGPVNYLGLLTTSVEATAAAAANDTGGLDRIAADLASIDSPWAAAIARRVDGLRHRDPYASADAGDRLAGLGMPYESACCQLESAEREPADSVRRASDALEVFERLGARPAADRARRTLRRLGHRPPPGRRSPGSLSERETQVAVLVAQGMTNADVAARLFISHRTVTTHLERIYRRLGITSRTELTRYVMESGTAIT